MNSNERLRQFVLRAVFWALGTLTAGTFCWIAWAVSTPGDYFAQGNPFAFPSIIVAGALGGYLAVRSTSRRFRVSLVILAIPCALFYGFAADGWWVTPPAHRRSFVQ